MKKLFLLLGVLGTLFMVSACGSNPQLQEKSELDKVAKNMKVTVNYLATDGHTQDLLADSTFAYDGGQLELTATNLAAGYLVTCQLDDDTPTNLLDTIDNNDVTALSATGNFTSKLLDDQQQTTDTIFSTGKHTVTFFVQEKDNQTQVAVKKEYTVTKK